jgi:hypothetical protein
MNIYKSCIPKTARERVVKRFADGSKREAEYRIGRKLVGRRSFFDTGEPESESAFKNGKRHGIEFRWFDPNILISAEPFVDGLAHGTARQWNFDGKLIGTYRMRRGTGIDLWRQERGDGSIYLAEVLYFYKGAYHGMEWWIDENQLTVYIERHWKAGQLHGVWREWNSKGRLRRGFPKYYVADTQVTKRQYLVASKLDLALPPFRLKDNLPARTFPPEIAKHLNPPARKPRRAFG